MDIALVLTSINGEGYKRMPADFAIVKGDFKKDSDLQNAIYVSLFFDRAADPSDKVTGSYTGGYWGDPFLGDPIGSKLWILERRVVTRETSAFAKKYVEEALKWLIDAGVVASFDINVTLRKNGDGINIDLQAFQPDGRSLNFNYSYLWQEIEDKI